MSRPRDAETVLETMQQDWEEATRRAFDALARYKFWMFGYHAARVVYCASIIERLGGPKVANPFSFLVDGARRVYCRDCGEMTYGEAHICSSTSLRWQEQREALLQLRLVDPIRAELDDPGE